MKDFSFKHSFRYGFILLFIYLLPAGLFSQGVLPAQAFFETYGIPADKCGYDEVKAQKLLSILGDHWGYGYDSLLADLPRWAQSPYVTIDSLGASVQNRALWQLTVTSDSLPGAPRKTVFIHARTHPGEVQAFWVADAVINLLLSETPFARFMRRNCTFYIIPMYNPDGVELEYARQNAHHVDLESNWNANPVEPEVAVLRSRFTQLMASNTPIEVALNMHSSYACKRYFVYHDAAGTSVPYTVLEQSFIGGVRSYFINGIEPWYYFVSWTNGTPPVYPESWFWIHFHEGVMALTYEDMNCSAAGNYDSTAYALVHGVADYLGLVPNALSDNNFPVPGNFSLSQNYPNPFNPTTSVDFDLPSGCQVELVVFNTLGQKVATLVKGYMPAGSHQVQWNGENANGTTVPSGLYMYRLQARTTNRSTRFSQIRKMILLR